MPTPPRLAPLLAQFEFAQERLLTRLVGLSDDEYLWEPVPGCWSIRPREQVRTIRAIGGGGWRLETASPPPDPAPFTTLAWRLCHLASATALRADYTIGTRALTWDDYTIPHTAAGGIAALTAALAAWHDALTGATDADLDQVGRSAFPWASTPHCRCSTSPGGSIRNCCTTAQRSRCCATSTGHGRDNLEPSRVAGGMPRPRSVMRYVGHSWPESCPAPPIPRAASAGPGLSPSLRA